MEKMLKLAGLAVASLGAVASASAASYEPAGCNCEITIPKYAGGFEFSLELFKVKTNEAGSNYAVTNNNLFGSGTTVSIPTGSDNTFNVHSVGSDYAMGYGLDFGYRIAGTGNDIHVMWSHYDESDSSSIATATGTTIDGLGVTSSTGPAATNISAAKGRIKHDVDVVDLEYGQRFNVGSNWEVRTHAGFRYASIERDFTKTYNTTASSPAANRFSENNESEFRGFGPRFGTSVRFPFSNGFGVKGELATSVLVGNVDDKFSFADNNVTNGINAFTLKSKDHKVVAPVVDASVSIDYTYNFSNDNSLMFELGYRMQNFFNTVHQESTNILSTLNSANVTDYGQHGAFLRAVLVV